MNFNEDDPRLTAYALREMHDPQERAEVEAALAADPKLQAAVDAIRATASVLSDALAQEPSPGLTTEQKAAVVKTHDHSQTKEKPRDGVVVSFLKYFQRHGLATAAVLCLLALVAAILLPSVGSVRYVAALDEARQHALREGQAPATPEAESEVAGRRYGNDEADMGAPIATMQEVETEPLGLVDSQQKAAALQEPLTLAEAGVQPREQAQSGRLNRVPSQAPVAPAMEAPQVATRPAPAASPQPRRELFAAADYDIPPPSLPAPPAPPAPAEGWNREGYDRIVENEFLNVADKPLSTFSIDVDTASYANARRFLQGGRLPPADAVRLEEMVNYFDYDYPVPEADTHPFSVTTEVGVAPWEPRHLLVQVGLQGYEIPWEERPSSNLVFLLDVSGSMNNANKLPLVKSALENLIQRLDRRDRVAIVVYAGASGLALPSTTADNHETIRHALNRLSAGGSTNGGQGIELAYQVAREHFIEGGNNRVILCTDGDFNVGVSDRGSLTRLIEQKAASGVFLSICGFGSGNLRDGMMEELSNKGNGNYSYIDSEREARRVFGTALTGTLLTIAKDVKIQVEFNPANVAAYRLLGYENRALADRDFNDDTKDAGEIGAGHTVTALYEIVPVGIEAPEPLVDPLRYGADAPSSEDAPALSSAQAALAHELMTVKLRYKQPDGDTSTLLSTVVEMPEVTVEPDKTVSVALGEPTENLRWASAVAEFALLLRGSAHAPQASWQSVLERARTALGNDPDGRRAEFLTLAQRARELQGQRAE